MSLAPGEHQGSRGPEPETPPLGLGDTRGSQAESLGRAGQPAGLPESWAGPSEGANGPRVPAARNARARAKGHPWNFPRVRRGSPGPSGRALLRCEATSCRKRRNLSALRHPGNFRKPGLPSTPPVCASEKLQVAPAHQPSMWPCLLQLALLTLPSKRRSLGSRFFSASPHILADRKNGAWGGAWLEGTMPPLQPSEGPPFALNSFPLLTLCTFTAQVGVRSL